MLPSAPEPARIRVLLRQRRPELAEQEARRQLGLFPHSAHLHALLALCLLRQARLPAALDAARRAAALDPEDDFAAYLLSATHLSLGEPQLAAPHVARALALNPWVADYHFIRGSVALAQADWPAALAAAEDGLVIDAQHVDCLNLRARALSRLTDRPAWEQAFDEALRENPTYANTHINLGYSYLEQNESAAAQQHFHAALHLDPSSEAARRGVVAAELSRSSLGRALLRPRRNTWFGEDWQLTLGLGLSAGIFLAAGVYVVMREGGAESDAQVRALAVGLGWLVLPMLGAGVLFGVGRMLLLQWQLLRPAVRHALPAGMVQVVGAEMGSLLAFGLTLAAAFLPLTWWSVGGVLTAGVLLAVAAASSLRSRPGRRWAGFGAGAVAVAAGATAYAWHHHPASHGPLLYFSVALWGYLFVFTHYE